MPTQRREEKRGPARRREPPALWLLFMYVFSSALACPVYTGLARSAVRST